jgi:cytochrome c biogenesis protein CcmG/thiol:disulfide interchange protein DsbE
MKRLVYLIPAALFVVLGVLFWQVLILREHEDPNALPSTLVGTVAPAVQMRALDAEAQAFTRADLGQGKPVIINFWASWCVECVVEAPVLNELAKRSGIPIYGIAGPPLSRTPADFKDEPGKARDFLKKYGNPFAKIDYDSDGRAGIEWGATGYPETLVIDGKGIVRVHYAHPLTDEAVRDIILPAAKP